MDLFPEIDDLMIISIIYIIINYLLFILVRGRYLVLVRGRYFGLGAWSRFVPEGSNIWFDVVTLRAQHWFGLLPSWLWCHHHVTDHQPYYKAVILFT